jgi:hypothetical protein
MTEYLVKRRFESFFTPGLWQTLIFRPIGGAYVKSIAGSSAGAGLAADKWLLVYKVPVEGSE